MTKKNFEWAAHYVRSMRTGETNEWSDARAESVENAYVAIFRHFGARFDEARFRSACEPRKDR